MHNEKDFFAQEKDVAIDELLNAFVDARVETKFPTNKKCFDEDVNVYISHLLFAISMPNYSYVAEQYVSLKKHDVDVLVDMAEDDYLKYFVYKVNADNLLLQLGLYHDFNVIQEVDGKALDMDGREAYIKRAKQYYQKAASLNRSIHRKKTALYDVLMKLSKHLDGYLNALGVLRKDYYFFANFFEDPEFYEFTENLSEYEKDIQFKAKQDQFLALYSDWLNGEKSDRVRSEINQLCTDMQSLDPSFKFYLEE